MKVLGIISSPIDPPSRIRICQYKKWFEINGDKLDDIYFNPEKEEEPSQKAIQLSRITRVNKWRIWNAYKKIARFSLLSKQYKYDVLWQSRLLIAKDYSLERFYRRPFVFDFDDAIWINEGEQDVIKAIQKADRVFAGNSYLCEFALKYNSSTFLIPTTVDTEHNFPIEKQDKHFTIGWIGTSSNFPYLETIKNALVEFLRKNNGSKLIIVSSIPPSFLPFDNKQIIFKKWDAENENELVNDFSIGIMPLPDNSWTRGKCGYKILQYMACNKPFIASPVGVNSSLIEKSQSGVSAITESDWMSKLHELKNDQGLYTMLAKNGRPYIDENFSAKKWSTEIIHQLKQTI